MGRGGGVLFGNYNQCFVCNILNFCSYQIDRFQGKERRNLDEFVFGRAVRINSRETDTCKEPLPTRLQTCASCDPHMTRVWISTYGNLRQGGVRPVPLFLSHSHHSLESELGGIYTGVKKSILSPNRMNLL